MKKEVIMKKIIFLVLVSVLIASFVQASPFLISDPSPNTTYFSIVMDGGSPVQSVPSATTALNYDLGTISTGSHNVTVAACNQWGCSSAVPFAFTKSVPVTPTGLKISL
jgi:hypothetical protein